MTSSQNYISAVIGPWWALILSALGFIIAITIHEFCHALAAYLLGDPTAQKEGRLSLNPLSHLDPLGLLSMLIIKIGWARPVPFNAQNFSFPRLFSVLVALAGPCANIVLAFFSMIALRYLPLMYEHGYLEWKGYLIVLVFFKGLAVTNVMLGIFNLIPIPPLDGSHLIRVAIPPQWKYLYDPIEKYSLLFLIILVNLPPFQKVLFAAIQATLEFLRHSAFAGA